MIRFQFKPSFERSLKHMSDQDKERVRNAIEKLARLMMEGEKTIGLGITRLRGNFWEARAGLGTRVLYQHTGDLIEVILAGNHDDIKHFLKHNG